MFFLIALSIGFIGGAFLGQFLARRGITADNALLQRQKQVYLTGAISLGFLTCVAIAAIAGQRGSWFPSSILLFVGAYTWYFVLLLCSFCIGLFLFLELPGWRNRKRLQQLILFLVVSCSATAFLAFQLLPIADLAQPSSVINGIVLQTTPYSCAAATIATLTRKIRPEQTTTEKEVIELAGTSRQGTSTLAEIYALEKLGLNPEYERGLTLEQLVKRNQMAILHVMEPVGTTKIQHAIALLAIDPVKRSLTVGNPLHGTQVKTFAEMQDYWFGEAVFVRSNANSPQILRP